MTRLTDFPDTLPMRDELSHRARRDRRRALITLAAVLVAAIAIVVVLAAALRGGGEAPSAVGAHGGFTIPAGDQAASHAFVTESAPGPLHLDLFLDYTDAASARFASINAQLIRSYLDRGGIEVSLHPVAVGATGAVRDDALRAGNAVACVGEFAPASLWSFHSVVLASQSDDRDQSLSTDDLIGFARDTGVTSLENVSECIRSDRFAGWIATSSEQAMSDGVGPTQGVELTTVPTVLADGTPYRGDPDNGEAFREFLAARAGN